MSSIPLFPNLKPRLIHASWFDVDQPCDDEDEVSQLERDHQNWLQMIRQKNDDLTPIGKTASETMEEDEEEDDEDDNDDDDESETHDEEEEDEIEMDVSQERSSPVDVSIRLVQGHGVR
ncbi:anaphase-promoting complex subunit 15-like [Diorhabda carinulata]|uniref:anaphase-promoting complex subunit 15 n=1 Tax=Diorhabda sublineata TaxID=1163346 RepID=UPI0024E09942|nr:anaphase-promoting complex subunit 15 [Diorhabda sublineata]XP_057661418.1 anaphase-promoting complex subunit 15-like [Diorhabda carinulata]